jgi:hypothetical protein
MAYTTINKPNQYFDTKLYTGNGSTQTITGLNFAPEFVWLKDRTSAYNHAVFDKVRGAQKRIFTNLTNTEDTASDTLTAFNSDGFTLGSNVGINTNSNNYVSWNWDANGAGVSNTQGTITSTVSANTTSGFSIVSYTGNSTAGATIGHGLGVKPSMIITKQRSGDVAEPAVYHTSTGATKFFKLNTSDAVITNSTLWNNTEPTSTVFTVGTAALTNASFPIIAYCFAEVKGFSKFGSYVGNGSTDGTFVYTGFKPAFVMLKASSSTSQWGMLDNKRNTFNPTAKELQASLSDAETDYTNRIDILSNGFKLKTTTSQNNSSGVTYIYMAFAEQPLVGTNNVPATAI